MGWASGSSIACEVGQAIRDNVKDKKARRACYEALVSALESEDWDCQNEATGIDPILDELLGLED
jgi:hypothetical protein